jgi:hypothetical protein
MKKDSSIMRVDASFTQYARDLQRKMVEREHKVPSMTEVTRRIAIESVHPYEEAKKGLRKIGEWKM